MALSRPFDLSGSTPYPVFKFGDNHINHRPSGTMIDGVKYPSSILDPYRFLNPCAPSYISSCYADEKPATIVKFSTMADLSHDRLTSSVEAIYGEDKAVMKLETREPLPKLSKSIVKKAGGILFFVPSKKRSGWDALLMRNAKNLYGDFGPVLYSTATDSFPTVHDTFRRGFDGLLKINTKIGSFVIPDEKGSYYEIFICTGNIYGDIPDNMMLFPLSGMTDIKEINKFNLPSVEYVLEISARFKNVLLNALKYGRFKYLCDNQPKK